LQTKVDTECVNRQTATLNQGTARTRLRPGSEKKVE